uniref:Uncharacterized protein n=1 Tax=Neogobius melanostomus TaxID=47308 RepID=A0A8C6TC18_9GOBI
MLSPERKLELDVIFRRLEKSILTFVKKELRRLHRLLSSEYPERSSGREEEQSSRDSVLNITLDFLRRMDQEPLAERLHNKSSSGVSRKLKSHLQQRFSHVFEGVAKAGDSAPLQQIYTELYITEGGTSEVNQEHEVRHMESMSRRGMECAITCEGLFKPLPESELPIRAVLTKGVAGIGKTVLTQKFSLDWAEGKAHQDIQLLFPFTFRELNVLRDTEYSLVELLHHFFSQTKGLCSFQQLEVLFIFDGLDECRLPLDFSRTRVLTEPTESASVEELLVNLIRGSLLPSARLWITTRPAAANQIPAECVSMVTEVRGFSDPQKEQYFRNRFRDEAHTIISHIKSVRSLYIMSNIPVFSWILSTVLGRLMMTRERAELPKTLTQMYVHFLVVQAKVKNIKYHEGTGADPHWSPETREMVRSLGKLAFEQLQKGNLIFYESDLSECGLDAAEIARYSGVFTEVFREEPGLYQDKVYTFIHLTVQEFLAALHVHQTFFSSGVNLLSPSHSSESPEDFYRSAVDQALQSPNGHLDLFLRFLLGLSLLTNQGLLQGLLTHTGSDLTNQETVKYIKQKLNEEGLSAERSLNLLHCLNELNDRSLLKDVQRRMKGHFSSPSEWSAMTFLLLSSDSDLEEFDLKSYQASEDALLRLTPLIKVSNKALLSGCGLSPHSCAPLASVLSSSSLTLLDLSNNNLQDIGVERLCKGLKCAPCRLETLRLSGCLVSERGGASLASALSSASSHLRELDLSFNHPGASAELLTALQAPHGPLQTLRLDPAGEQWMVPGLRKYSREFTLDPNTAHEELQLSENNRMVTRCWTNSLLGQHAYALHVFLLWGRVHRDLHCQVLSSTGLRGRCYWEVEWKLGEEFQSRQFRRRAMEEELSTGVEIAVGYRGSESRRSERYAAFWSLRVSSEGYSAHHNDTQTAVFSPHSRSSSGRVAVFLDSEAGSVSFYEVLSERLSHLHTFNATFTEPLFPGFKLAIGSSVSLCEAREWSHFPLSLRRLHSLSLASLKHP